LRRFDGYVGWFSGGEVLCNAGLRASFLGRLPEAQESTEIHDPQRADNRAQSNGQRHTQQNDFQSVRPTSDFGFGF
jgi:hypothetical protein